jgi:hypothetical protein
MWAIGFANTEPEFFKSLAVIPSRPVALESFNVVNSFTTKVIETSCITKSFTILGDKILGMEETELKILHNFVAIVEKN